MGTTPNFAIPYPEGTDQPAGHTQMKALAERVDTVLPTLGGTSVYCVAGGTLDAVGNSWTNVVHTIREQSGGFTVSGGQIAVPEDGVYMAVGWIRGKASGWTSYYAALTGVSGVYGAISTVPGIALTVPVSGAASVTAGTLFGLRAQYSSNGTASDAQVETSELVIVRLAATRAVIQPQQTAVREPVPMDQVPEPE